MYASDRGLEELLERRGEEEVAIAWLVDRLREYIDYRPQSESTLNGFATWLARDDTEADDELDFED